MDSYNIDFKPSAEKDLRNLPKPIISRIMAKIEKLGADLFHSKPSNYLWLNIYTACVSAIIGSFTK
jgi:mRNA-degrading endonuclease RelE of RelBE toxin-antitoxin system